MTEGTITIRTGLFSKVTVPLAEYEKAMAEIQAEKEALWYAAGSLLYNLIYPTKSCEPQKGGTELQNELSVRLDSSKESLQIMQELDNHPTERENKEIQKWCY